MATSQEEKKLHAGHREHMREAFRRNGFSGMQPHQILEMLLYQTVLYVDTNPIAHRLLNRFGTLSNVLEAPEDELLQVEGVKPNTAFFLHMIPELFRAYGDDKEREKNCVYSTSDAIRLMAPKFLGRSTEIVVLVLIGSNHEISFCDVLFEGAIHSVPVYMRKIIDLCIRQNADSIFIAHNHPSGIAFPSQGDLETTRELLYAMENIHVRLADHIIFGGTKNQVLSMVDSGWMDYLTETVKQRKKEITQLTEQIETYLSDTENMQESIRTYAADRKGHAPVLYTYEGNPLQERPEQENEEIREFLR